MRFKKLFVYLMSFIGLLSLFVSGTEPVFAGPNSGSIQKGSGLVSSKIARPPNNGEKMDGKFATIAKMNKDTKIRVMGDTSVWHGEVRDKTANYGVRGLFGFDATAAAKKKQKGKIGTIYTNIGYKNGRPLDLAIVVTDWNPETTLISFSRATIAVQAYPASTGVGLQSKWLYLDHETHQPVKVGGYYTFTDIDWWQSASFKTATMSHVKQIYTPIKDTWLSAKKVPDGLMIYDGTKNGKGGDNAPQQEFTILYDETTELDFTFIDGHKNAENIMKNFSTKSYADFTKTVDADSLQTGKLPLQNGGAYFGYSSRKPLPTKTVEPGKVVSDKDEKKVASNTLAGLSEPYSYDIVHTVPNETAKFYYKSYSFVDDLDFALVPGKVKVISDTGADVTKWFNNKSSGQTTKLEVKPETLKSADFYGHDYTFHIDTSIKDGVNLDNRKKNGIVTLPNKATVTIDGLAASSATVTTRVLLNGGISIVKHDANTQQVLAGAEYRVNNAKGQIIGTIVTDKNGKGQLTGLDSGHYTLVETKAPVGYELDKKVYPVDLVAGQTVVVNGNRGLVDLPSMSAMRVVKKNSVTGKPVAGATYEITNSKGVVVGQIVTGKDGAAILKNLPAGTYKVQEIKAPKGYELDPEIHTVKLVAGKQVSAPVLENPKEMLPNTGSKTLLIAGIVAIASGLGLALLTKLKRD